MLIAAIAQSVALGAAPAARCPTTPLSIVSPAHPMLPDGTHPTHSPVRVILDLGSDGRVRHAAIADSSGDTGRWTG